MPRESLHALLERNRRHSASLSPDAFDDHRDGQAPPVVSVCCSDSRVSQERMLDATEPGYLFTPSNIGNLAFDEHDGDRIVDGNLLYPLAHADTGTVVVVGHTGCGAVTAAYEHVSADTAVEPDAVRRRVELLVPVIEDGLADPRVDDEASTDDVVADLVEYNVRQQVSFLEDCEDVPADVDAYGLVYDLHEQYGDDPGRTYLVAANGPNVPEQVSESLSDEDAAHLRSRLDG